jgi:hypothetical protein
MIVLDNDNDDNDYDYINQLEYLIFLVGTKWDLYTKTL